MPFVNGCSRRDQYLAHIGTEMPVAALGAEIANDAHLARLVPRPDITQSYIAPWIATKGHDPPFTFV